MSSPAVCDWVFEHARLTPDASAVDSPQARLTYGMLADRTMAMAAALQGVGVRAGDRVLVVLPSAPAAVVVSLAVQHVGAVAVEVSREWSAEQLALVVAQVQPRAIAYSVRDANKLAACSGAAEIRSAIVVSTGKGAAPSGEACLGASDVVVLTEGGEMVRASGGKTPALAPPQRDRGAVTLLLYTSGSTGTPRAVMQTMTNIAENTRSIVEYLQLSARDRAMLILPLSYCYGRSVLQTHLFVGGSVVLDPRFMYPRVVLEAIASEQCTGFAGVPLTFELLRRQAQVDITRMPSLRYVTQAGGAMSQHTAEWARSAFQPARLFIMYGQTEATARLAYLPPERAHEKRGSIGVAIPRVELRVVDDTGQEVGCRVNGHLVARGPNVTPGYYRAPEETSRILRDGWLWTGDMAYRDEEGFFYVVGRAKDVLKIGGHRASAAQIEAVLADHRDVLEVAVVGLADALMGEVPGALVVVRPGAPVTERDLQRFCGQRLPPYLTPRLVRFALELPRGPSGKVSREQVVRTLETQVHDAVDGGRFA